MWIIPLVEFPPAATLTNRKELSTAWNTYLYFIALLIFGKVLVCSPVSAHTELCEKTWSCGYSMPHLTIDALPAIFSPALAVYLTGVDTVFVVRDNDIQSDSQGFIWRRRLINIGHCLPQLHFSLQREACTSSILSHYEPWLVGQPSHYAALQMITCHCSRVPRVQTGLLVNGCIV